MILFKKNLLFLLLITPSITLFAQQERPTKLEREIKAKQEAADRREEAKERRFQERFEAANRIYNYPIDLNQKITYKKEVYVSGLTQEAIYKRLKKFIALEQFDKSIQIQCKEDRAFVTAQPFQTPIIFDDEELHEITFNGYFPFQILNFKHCLLTFQGKLIAKEDGFSYQFYDFNVIEFRSASKTKSKGGSTYWGYGLSTSRGTSTFSDTNTRISTLEKFMQNPDYAVTSHDIFNESRRAMIKRLRNIVSQQ